MSIPKGRAIVEAANYVTAIYRNLTQMLLSCDPVAGEYGLVPYRGAWRPMETIKPRLSEPEWWLPHRAVRQYHRRGRADQEVFTIGAYLWDPRDPEFPEPIAVASMMSVTRTNSDNIYWVALLGGHYGDPATRGSVHTTDIRKLNKYDDDWSGATVDFIVDHQLTSIEVPLLDITTTADVDKRLIRPLVEAVRTKEESVVVASAS